MLFDWLIRTLDEVSILYVCVFGGGGGCWLGSQFPNTVNSYKNDSVQDSSLFHILKKASTNYMYNDEEKSKNSLVK